jgi:uncharacterized protein DUF6046
MANEFNLKEIFAQQFGYTPQDFKISPKDVLTKKTPGYYGRYYEEDKQGRDVFMPMTIGGDVFLPYIWVSVRGSKTIVETPMTERHGSVKELISINDYEFAVKGLLVGHDGRFPEKEVEELRRLFERNESLTIKCILTDIYLLSTPNQAQDKVVIYDHELFENKGVEHVRGFSFNMKADSIFELEMQAAPDIASNASLSSTQSNFNNVA